MFFIGGGKLPLFSHKKWTGIWSSHFAD